MSNEFSELQAVDFAFGAYIAGAFDGLNPDSGPKQWKEFLARDVDKKIFREASAAPSDFLKNLAASGKTEKVIDGIKYRLPQVPVLYFYRSPGMTNGDTRNFPRMLVGMDDKAFRLTLSPIVLDYHLVLVSWDTLSLDKLQLAWYQYVIRSNRFTVQYELEGSAFEIPAAIRDPYTLMFTDVSTPKGDGRLYAVDTLITVETSTLFGLSVVLTPTTITGGAWGGYSCYDMPLVRD